MISAAGYAYFSRAHSSDNTAVPENRKVLFWYDPMYPNTRFDKPGKSPFMDMDLVAKYADEETGDAASAGIHIDPTQTQNLGLKTQTVQRGHYVIHKLFRLTSVLMTISLSSYRPDRRDLLIKSGRLRLAIKLKKASR